MTMITNSSSVPSVRSEYRVSLPDSDSGNEQHLKLSACKYRISRHHRLNVSCSRRYSEADLCNGGRCADGSFRNSRRYDTASLSERRYAFCYHICGGGLWRYRCDNSSGSTNEPRHCGDSALYRNADHRQYDLQLRKLQLLYHCRSAFFRFVSSGGCHSKGNHHNICRILSVCR